MIDIIKSWFDIGAIVVLLGWFVDLLPAIATGLTIAWTLIRIYETPTMQRLARKLRTRSGRGGPPS